MHRQQKYMSYKICLLLLGVAAVSLAYSDITMLNCPAQFDVTVSNVTTDTAAATIGSFVYGAFQTSAAKKRVKSIVVNGDTQDLSAYISEMMVPYIIFAAIFVGFYLFIVMCCLFDRSCPPCDKIRRDLDNDPYSKRQLRVATFCTLLFAAGVLIVCVISFSFIPDMKKNMEMTSCSIYLSIDTAINGDGEWGGFVSLRDKVGNITNLLSAAVTQIQIYFPGDSWLTDTMQSMQNNNINIYKTYQAAKLISPNPDATATAANAGQATPMIDSVFIKTGMGPNGTLNTMVTDIDSGLRTTAKLSEQARRIEASANLLTASLNTILNNSQSNQNTLIMYNHQMETMTSEFTTFSDAYFITAFGNALSVFQGVFAFALTGSLLALLGVIATHLFDLFTCRRMVHLGWTVFGIVYIGIIVVTFVVLSVGSIGYGFCEYYKVMLTDQSAYGQLGVAYTQNAFMRVDTCIFGDGNALSKFGLAKQMGTVEDLFTNIQTYYDYLNSLSSNYVNIAYSTGKLTTWISTINNYKLGIKTDADSTQTNSDNPNYALSQLNLYTYQGGGVATGSKDIWVWDITNCTDPTQIKYISNASAGTTLSVSNVTCISFNEKLTNGSSNIWSFSDFTMRYVQIRQNYIDAYKMIVYYGQTLIAFRDSRINLFQAVQDGLTDLLSENTNFNTMLGNFKNRVDQFYSAVSTLNNLITNPLNGLIVSSNCHSLADKMRFTYNVFCVNFMAQIVKLVLCSLSLLVLLLGGVLAGSRFGMMYAEMEKLKRINMPQQPQSQKDIHMDQNDSTSSNSNEEED